MPFLGWIISQLLRQAEVVPTLVHDLYKRGEEPNIAELLDSLEKALRPWTIVYVVVDAIDESSASSDLLPIIRELTTDPKFSKIHMLITSREYRGIEREMKKISAPISMSNPLVEDDIQTYVRSALNSNTKFRPWPADLLSEVEGAVSTQAKGMYVLNLSMYFKITC